SPRRSPWNCWSRRWPAFGKTGCPSRAEERRNRGSIDLRRHGNVRRHGEPPSTPLRRTLRSLTAVGVAPGEAAAPAVEFAPIQGVCPCPFATYWLSPPRSEEHTSEL